MRSETVGGDLERYLPEYENVEATPFLSLFLDGLYREPGYLLIEKLFGYVMPSHRGYLIFTSFIILFLFFKAIYRYADDVFIPILLFYLVLFGNSLNILRASMATAICLNSFQYIYNRNFGKFLLLTILAALIQKTAIAFIPIYFLYGRTIKPVVLFSLIAGVVLFVLAFSGSSLASFVNTYSQLFAIEEDSEYLIENPSIVNPMFFFLLGLTCLGVYGQKISRKTDETLNFFVLVMATATCIQAFSSVFTMMNRIAYFYYAFVIFYIPYLIFTVFRRKTNKVVILSVILLLIFYMFVNGLIKDPQMITPYELL